MFLSPPLGATESACYTASTVHLLYIHSECTPRCTHTVNKYFKHLAVTDKLSNEVGRWLLVQQMKNINKKKQTNVCVDEAWGVYLCLEIRVFEVLWIAMRGVIASTTDVTVNSIVDEAMTGV